MWAICGETIFSTTGKPISAAISAASSAVAATPSGSTGTPAAASRALASASPMGRAAIPVGPTSGNMPEVPASNPCASRAMVASAATAREGSAKVSTPSRS